MTDMTAVSATPAEQPPTPIEPVASVSARFLSRNMAATLRSVADEGHSYAVEHFGRVVGFLIPAEGRAPVQSGRRTVYEVPEPEPVLELDEVQASILETVYRLDGRAAPDELVGDHSLVDTLVALAALERFRLLVKTVRGYELTDAGERHAKALGA